MYQTLLPGGEGLACETTLELRGEISKAATIRGAARFRGNTVYTYYMHECLPNTEAALSKSSLKLVITVKIIIKLVITVKSNW